jgi:beta-glucanase (GH16 family)
MNGATGCRVWAYSTVVLLLAACATPAKAQLLLRDDFDSDGTGIVDPTVWRLPFGVEGTFVGRTQFRGDPAVDMPLQGVAELSADDDKVMELHLDTYSVIDPGNQFLGTDILTKRNFARGGGLTFEARMRLKPTTAGGLVNGFFVYDVQRENPPGTLVRDEIDFELISNQAVGAATNDPFTNYWNDEPFSDPGDGQFSSVAGVDLTQFQDYKVEWTPQSMKWYVNNQLVRTSTTNVPDDPMKLHFNLWAPDSSFADAFNAALQPTNVQANNQRYSVQVDHVEVNRINTTTSANLLVDAGFEDSTTPAANGTGGWTLFNNSSRQTDFLHDGFMALKTFGPYLGGTNASGAYQNVVAAPGQEFEGSIWAFAPSSDSILGNQNFTTLTLQFVNSAGAVIGSVNFSPGTNQEETPIFDGRDPNMPEDQWVQYTANALAPAGTAFARINAFFVQLLHDGNMLDGGAVWFDDASLVRLTPDAAPGLAGDYNNDGVVDAVDYTVWRNNLNDPTEADLNNNGDGGDVGPTDYTWWKQRYGNTAAGAGGISAVPEPSTIAVIGLGLMGVLAVRRRRS